MARLQQLGRREPGLSYIYLIEAPGTGLWKIGKADDVPARFSTMRSGSPVPLVLHSVVAVPKAAAYEAERQVGFYFWCFSARRRLRPGRHGEWFCLKPRDIRVVQMLMMRLAIWPPAGNPLYRMRWNPNDFGAGERAAIKSREGAKLWYAEHREEVLARLKARYASNAEHRKQMSEYQKARRAANPEKARARDQAYCDANRERINTRKRAAKARRKAAQLAQQEIAA